MNARTALITFMLYSLGFEAFVWGGGIYVILHYGLSHWWVAFLLFLSGSQIPPHKWHRVITGKAPEEQP